MKVEDYYRVFADAPVEFFQEISDDADLMDYAIQVVDQWMEDKMDTESIAEEMEEKVYTFLSSLGMSMFVQGYAANSLRKRLEMKRLFEGDDDA